MKKITLSKKWIFWSVNALLAVLALSGVVAKFAKDDDNLTGE